MASPSCVRYCSSVSDGGGPGKACSSPASATWRRYTRRARIFAGYAGWAPGQLEAELGDESWIVEPPLPDEIFSDDPERLWNAVLRRKGGRYTLLARMPEDLSVN